jgi:N4-gp56 family major capsid protein
MSWTYDAPSNTYKNFTLSTKIRRQAIADTQFMKFLTPEPGYGRKKGESITITRILQLPLATRVAETDRLPSGRPGIETKQVKVSEWGFKIPVTDLEKNLTFYDPMNQFQQMLNDQMKLTMDGMGATAFKLTPIKYVPLAAGSSISTNGTASGTSDTNMSIANLREIHDYLHDNLKTPYYSNGKYVGILSTKAARGIKNDPEYKDWFAPNTSEPLVNGQLKDVEGFTLIETNNTNALARLAGGSVTTGEAVFFGADAAGMLEVTSPEIRMGMPEDLGRFSEVGWVGVLDAFLVWETASLARVVHVTSA